MHNFLVVLPLIVVLIMLLPPIRAHVIVAGFVGGILAMIIGGLSIGDSTALFTEGVSRLYGITSVLLFASTAMVLARAGSISSTLAILNRWLKGKVQWVAASMVIVQGLAVYGAGHGAANTLVIAPLIFTAVGFNPLTVVGLSLASGASWATSPASAESGVISQAMGWSVQQYATFMLPFTAVIWVLGAVLAYIGVSQAIKKGTLTPGVPPVGAEGEGEEASHGKQVLLGSSETKDWMRALPFFVLLLCMVFGPIINRSLDKQVLTTFSIPFLVLLLAAALSKIPFNSLAEEFVKGSRAILMYLFVVGVFLGFVNLMGAIGTFEVLASLPGALTGTIVGIAALIIAFVIAIPSAAYTAAIDALLLPVMAATGVPVVLFGFVGIVVAQGAMMSPVQVNVSATAHGFRTTVMNVVKNNAPYMPFACLLTIIMSQIASVL
jgi:hypothetical protein